MSVTETAAGQTAGLQRAAGSIAQTCPAVTLEIGVFFDGTGNNAANVNGPSSRFSDSYNASKTNVVLLRDLYLRQERYWPRNSCGYAIKRDWIYMQGIGTTAGQSDWRPRNLVGAAVGMGPTGIEARVFEACLEVGQKITQLSPGVEPTEVVLDVFGFSRGAAAARYFVNCFRQGFIEYDSLDYSLLRGVHIDRNRASVPRGRKVRIRFIGIFDTVAAVGSGKNSDNGPVNVHMSTAQADGIMHLIAVNEYRANFRLNHNWPDGGPYRRCTGAHSDIGGGYAGTGSEALVEKVNTKVFPTRRAAEAARAVDVARAEAARNSLESFYVQEGWIAAGDPRGGLVNEPGPIRQRTVSNFGVLRASVYTYTTAARLNRPWVRLGLSRIPLALMYDAAIASGVPFDALPSGGEYEIPQELRGMAQTMRSGGTPSRDMQRKALLEFGHMSSNFDKTGMSPKPGFMEPEAGHQSSNFNKTKRSPEADLRRSVDENDATKAR